MHGNSGERGIMKRIGALLRRKKGRQPAIFPLVI